MLVLVSLLLFVTFAHAAPPGGDLNLTGRAALISRTGYDLNLGTQSTGTVRVVQNNVTTLSINGSTGVATFSGVPVFTGGLGALTVSDNITFSAADKGLLVSGVDKRLLIYGGSTQSNAHASLELHGSGYSSTQGDGYLTAGSTTTTAKIRIGAPGSSGKIEFATTAFATVRWNIDSVGDLNSDGTNGGNFNLVKAGTKMTVKAGGGGATAGTVVCNGTSDVVTNTTSMVAGNLIVFSLNTIGGTVGAIPRVKSLSSGTSFTINCTAGDTSTYNWIMFGVT